MGNEKEEEFWFRAKTYGWGWGLPLTWQGWVVFAIYFVLFGVGIVNIYAKLLPIPYVPFFVIITAALVLVCWLKGETPRWRWGKD